MIYAFNPVGFGSMLVAAGVVDRGRSSGARPGTAAVLAGRGRLPDPQRARVLAVPEHRQDRGCTCCRPPRRPSRTKASPRLGARGSVHGPGHRAAVRGGRPGPARVQPERDEGAAPAHGEPGGAAQAVAVTIRDADDQPVQDFGGHVRREGGRPRRSRGPPRRETSAEPGSVRSAASASVTASIARSRSVDMAQPPATEIGAEPVRRADSACAAGGRTGSARAGRLSSGVVRVGSSLLLGLLQLLLRHLGPPPGAGPSSQRWVDPSSHIALTAVNGWLTPRGAGYSFRHGGTRDLQAGTARVGGLGVRAGRPWLPWRRSAGWSRPPRRWKTPPWPRCAATAAPGPRLAPSTARPSRAPSSASEARWPASTPTLTARALFCGEVVLSSLLQEDCKPCTSGSPACAPTAECRAGHPRQQEVFRMSRKRTAVGRRRGAGRCARTGSLRRRRRGAAGGSDTIKAWFPR